MIGACLTLSGLIFSFSWLSEGGGEEGEGAVNLSHFFITFVRSSVPVNKTRWGRGQVDRIYCPCPSGLLKRKLVNGQGAIKP